VVVGRSPILGKPMALMLLNANCTVTICHSRTQDLPQTCQAGRHRRGCRGKPEFHPSGLDQGRRGGVDAGYHPVAWTHRSSPPSPSASPLHPGARRRRADDDQHADTADRADRGARARLSALGATPTPSAQLDLPVHRDRQRRRAAFDGDGWRAASAARIIAIFGATLRLVTGGADCTSTTS